MVRYPAGCLTRRRRQRERDRPVTHEDHPSYATGTAALQAGWYHGHRDVSGGWLRPAVFGAVGGLVTNASLISGLGGGGVPAHTVVLTGVAALVAGAFLDGDRGVHLGDQPK